MPKAPTRDLPPSRRRLFRLLALSLPLVVVLALEAGLRLAGTGYPTAYFLKASVAGKKVWIENQDFTRRFFPAALVRTPHPVVFPRDKPPGRTRIFIFGESAAMGDPAPAYGFGRILKVLLEDRKPGREMEVINLATTAINSHVIRDQARDSRDKGGDIWLIYMGHNEVVGPYGAGTIFSSQTPALPMIRAGLAWKWTRLGQWMDDWREGWRAGKEGVRRWGGMEMFLDQQVRATDPAMRRVYGNFRDNLKSILEEGVKARARILVCSVASNLKDCPPFASALNPDLNEVVADGWRRIFQEGSVLLESGQPGAALALFRECEGMDATSAALHFRMGQCYRETGDRAKALASFQRARDLDTLRFRVDTRLNTIIRDVAEDQDARQVRFLDSDQVMSQASLGFIPGRELFFEHVHPNWEGNYQLALAMAEQLHLWLAEDTDRDGSAQGWLSSEDCAARLAYTDWDRAKVMEEVIKRLEQPPFIGQWGASNRLDLLRQEQVKWSARSLEKGWAAEVGIYEEALEQAPEDFLLRERYATYLQEHRDRAGALAQWQAVLHRHPRQINALYQAGNMLDQLGRSEESLTFFNQALRIRPALHEPLNGKALALDRLGRTEEAIRTLEEALVKKPDFTEARINLGQILAGQGRVEEALVHYERALSTSSNSVAAHLNLGKLLSEQDRLNEAEAHYRTAVKLAPQSGVAWFNLGNLLTRKQDPDNLRCYEKAVQADPDLVEARLNFGLTLARRGYADLGLEQFRELVRRRPDFAPGHLNLGISLAKKGEFAAAIRAFEETLRLDPGNQAAQTFLDKARARQD